MQATNRSLMRLPLAGAVQKANAIGTKQGQEVWAYNDAQTPENTDHDSTCGRKAMQRNSKNGCKQQHEKSNGDVRIPDLLDIYDEIRVKAKCAGSYRRGRFSIASERSVVNTVNRINA